MKKFLLLGLLLALALGGCAITGPYATVKNIREGVKTRDPVLLNENIDFPVLRQNLKEQATAMMVKRSGLDGPLADIAGGFAGALAGSVIDYVITPEGLSRIMSGELTSLVKKPKPEPTEGGSSSSETAHEQRSEKIFKDARYSFDSSDQFSIWARNNHDKETRFVLSREGLKWKLTNIILPEQP